MNYYPKSVQKRCRWLENHPLGFHQVLKTESNFQMYYLSFRSGQLAYYPKWNEFHLSINVAPGIAANHIKLTIQGGLRLIREISEAEGLLPKYKDKLHHEKQRSV